jgi:hypothetical protein
MMHDYFLSLTVILETEIWNHPALFADWLIEALANENNQ